MTAIVLPTISNVVGHLTSRSAPLFNVILISWLIAFAEYCFQVPDNRIGSYEFSTVQLKTIQEVITPTVLSAFLRVVSGRAVEMELPGRLRIDRAAVFVIFKKW
jgi:uncharacterized protein